MTVDGATVVVVGAGYPGKRGIHERMAALGARLVIVDEPGHWSMSLVDEGIAVAWLPTTVLGDADTDADAVLKALTQAQVSPDAVVTFWENSTAVAARVAERLGRPTNPVAAVDAARSKVRTRELSAILGLPTPKARRVHSLDELFAASGFVGLPAVVKPEFGAGAIGCMKIERLEQLPEVYSLVRAAVDPDADDIFRSGNDLLVEEYLDGVEFDVDLVMHNGTCVFSSVSQNWPTLEPSFQESGLHCPPDFDKRQVARLVDLCVATAQGFDLNRGVLHIEGKCTSRGPRIVEVNARMGGGRIHEFVEAVWEVDLVEAHLRCMLGLDPELHPARRPQAAVVDQLVYADRSGRVVELIVDDSPRKGVDRFLIDVDTVVGADAVGPERVFATLLLEAAVIAKDLKTARSAMAEALRTAPRIVSADAM